MSVDTTGVSPRAADPPDASSPVPVAGVGGQASWCRVADPSGCIGPSYQDLRPLKSVKTQYFPVYDDAVDRLVDLGPHPRPEVAHLLATCAGYAYSEVQTVATILARMGLPRARCRYVAQTVDPMFICSRCVVIQSECRRVVIVCYRGTEPMNLINWLTNADVQPSTAPFRFTDSQVQAFVHGGFYRNVRSTRHEVVNALARAIRGQWVYEPPGGADLVPVPEREELEDRSSPLEAIYITGHSLGGAMAAVLGLMLRTNRDYEAIFRKVRAIYTFGQPMIGDPDLAARCENDEELGSRLIRYIHARDVVPSLPPKPSGEFKHFGQEYRYGAAPWLVGSKAVRRLRLDLLWTAKQGPASRWVRTPATTQLGNAGTFLTSFLPLVARSIRGLKSIPFAYSIEDHAPQKYIDALRPPDVPTEFGDPS